MNQVKNRKRWIALAAILCVLLTVLVFLRPWQKDKPLTGNLLTNGDFALVSGGMPEGWQTGMWVSSPGTSFLEATEKDGHACVLVENAAENDARFEQTVMVRPGSLLHLSALVCAERCGDKLGANVSFLGVYGSSLDFSDTGGEWKRADLYASVPAGMREVTVCLRLGGYGSLATGRCWFTDASLEEVDSVPVGAAYVDLATPEPRQESSSLSGSAKDTTIPILILSGIAYVLLSLWLFRKQPVGGIPALFVLLLSAFLLRLFLAFHVEGYGVDMGCFSAWAARMSESGPAAFYETGYFCDYPPAYILLLGLTGLLARLFSLPFSGMGMQVLLKLSPIFCDLLIAVFFWRSLRKQSEGTAFTAAALVAANPALIVTGSCWGQIDAVTALLLLLVLSRAREGNWRFAIPLFALAVLTKPQAGLLAPLGLAALGKEVFSSGDNRRNVLREIAYGLLFGILVTLAFVLPFSPRQSSPFWLADRYTQTLGSYNYATLSTGNLMFLLGGNWKENAATLFGPVTYGQFGMALMILSFAFGLLVYLKGKGRQMLFPAAAVTLQLVFCLGSKMHERYIVPALLLLLMAAFETGDARFFASFALASAASAVNIGVVLAYEYLIAPNLWLGYLLSVAQLLPATLTLWACVDLSLLNLPARPLPQCSPMHAHAAPADSGETGTAQDENERLRQILMEEDGVMPRPSRTTLLSMLFVTLVYAAVAFYDLGTTKAPQTGYTSTREGEEILLDLGETLDGFHFYYYGGISDTQFSVSTSADGDTWSEPVRAFFDRGECFKWQALRRPSLDEDGIATGASGGMLNLAGRYIRIIFDGAGSALWETAAVDGSGKPYPIASVTSSGALENRADDPAKVCDEQNTVPEKPSYQNSMYFDEIYHARTGYEHAHALPMYETTHPPLGKDLMALCIRLFGMTPFAWRLAGCLAGILMLPVLWLLALRLLKSQRAALLSCVLFACDCMHFTQTRIATIDSFPVLFMLLMFLFMAKWREMNLFAGRFSRTLLPLLLSGICMGLAIASKWIGCYGAVGLAVLFFGRFFEQARLFRRAKASSDPELAAAVDVFPKRAGLTVAWCCFSFVLVPLAIYCASYVPYLSHFGPVAWNARTFRRIWDAQVLMFDYHKNLVATHYFSSPWYEWPLVVKPMWYYNADYAAPGMASSILSFGNPAVWWTGLAAILAALFRWLRNLPLRFSRPGERTGDGEALTMIAVGFLSAYLPWVLVPRLTFIYHYFASVPFIILATAWGLQKISLRRPRAGKIFSIVLCAAALLLFIGFYPLASGHEVPRSWCDFMNWFKGSGWMWY